MTNEGVDHVVSAGETLSLELNNIEDELQDNDSDGQKSNDEDDDSDDPDERKDDEPVPSLVSGREKRTTAGSRLSTLLTQEADDEVSLLFADDGEEDVDFEGSDEDVSDVRDDSSSDEDDGPTGTVEESLEGEAELKMEERATKQAQKRKAMQAFARPTLSKKVKIAHEPSTAQDISSPTSTTRRPRTRLQRVSWLTTSGDGITRTSSRTLSVKNKEKTMANMKESEGKKVRQIAIIQASSKKNGIQKMVMSQVERLAEAEKVERINSRSLNRWEQAEKERMERQKARLEALQNRQLAGPVIRWYSGPAEWLGETLVRVGKKTKIEVLESEINVSSSADAPAKVPSLDAALSSIHLQQSATLQTVRTDAENTETAQNITDKSTTVEDPEVSNMDTEQVVREHSPTETRPATTDLLEDVSMVEAPPIIDDSRLGADPTASHSHVQDQDMEDDVALPTAILDGIGYYASLPGGEKDGPRSIACNTSKSADVGSGSEFVNGVLHDTSEQLFNTNDIEENREVDVESIAVERPSGPEVTSEASIPVHFLEGAVRSVCGSPGEGQKQHDGQSVLRSTQRPELLEEVEPRDPPVLSYSARNMVMFLGFDADAIKNRDVQRRIIFGMKDRRQAEKKPYRTPTALCAITSAPAKYRDPSTLLPYASIEGYRSIQRLLQGGPVWSDLLSAWVGSDTSTGKAASIWAPAAPLAAAVTTTTSASKPEDTLQTVV